MNWWRSIREAEKTELCIGGGTLRLGVFRVGSRKGRQEIELELTWVRKRRKKLKSLNTEKKPSKWKAKKDKLDVTNCRPEYD